ncbi:MAG: acyltransferase [Candidatus Dormiibacterota bacterium]
MASVLPMPVRTAAGRTHAAPGARPKRAHLPQVDLMRIIPMLAVLGVHVTIFTQPATAVGAQGLTVLLHTSRFAFFFITSFVLFYSYGSAPIRLLSFWRKRFPPILLPYVAWTLIYWQFNRWLPWGGFPSTFPASLGQLGQDLAQGWFQLYFLLVTMQFYLVFPLVAWLVRRLRGHHLHLLLVSAALELAWLAMMQYGWSSLPGVLQAVYSQAQVELPSYQFFFVAGGLAAAHMTEIAAWLRRHVWGLTLAAIGLVALGWALYAMNLLLGEAPATAAGVFQPAALAMFGGSMLGLGLIAQRFADTRPPAGRFWRFFGWAGEISFGIYLSHMISLQLLSLPAVQSALRLDQLPVPLTGVAVWALTVAGSVVLVTTLRHLPLATILTGRPRRRLPRWRRSRPTSSALAS